MGKFVYIACPTNPLKGPELSTLNLAWVQSSILWQYFLSYAYTQKKERKKDTTSTVSVVINFCQETEQEKRRKIIRLEPRLFKLC